MEIKMTVNNDIWQMQQRQIRDGNALLFQSRKMIISNGGEVTYTEWWTSGKILNYGDVYDERPSIWQRLKNWL